MATIRFCDRCKNRDVKVYYEDLVGMDLCLDCAKDLDRVVMEWAKSYQETAPDPVI